MNEILCRNLFATKIIHSTLSLSVLVLSYLFCLAKFSLIVLLKLKTIFQIVVIFFHFPLISLLAFVQFHYCMKAGSVVYVDIIFLQTRRNCMKRDKQENRNPRDPKTKLLEWRKSYCSRKNYQERGNT